MTERPDVPHLVLEDETEALTSALTTLQRVFLTHPEATRAAFQALVREGRQFGATQEGAQWRDRLSKSALLSRAHFVAQVASFWITSDDEPSTTPSAFVDAVAAAARSSDKDLLIDRVIRAFDEGR